MFDPDKLLSAIMIQWSMAGIKFWTEEKVNFLKSHYYKIDNLVLASQLGCKVNALHNYASKIGITKKGTQWSLDQTKIILALYGKTSNAEIGKLVGKSAGAVRCHAQVLKLVKRTSYHWTPSQEQYLLEVYGKLPSWELQEIFKRSKSSIGAKYRTLIMLKKDSM